LRPLDRYVCRTCHDKALRVRGHCPGCGADRALPGLRADDHVPICPDCAGFTVSCQCVRCGHEGKLHTRHLCTRCTFTDRLTGRLDDGTGRIRPELAPLADSLLAMGNPLSGLMWLYTRKGKTDSPEYLLRRLGRGEIELTHQAFRSLQPWRAAAHLRELLMACGVLPAVDKQICLFERWLVGYLADITDPEHAQLVRRFATWEVLPRLRTRAEKKPLTPAARRYAGDSGPSNAGSDAASTSTRPTKPSPACAVCKVAIRTRERLAILRPRHGILVLHTLRWLEEIRDRGDLTSSAPVTDRELQLAEVLMDALAGVDRRAAGRVGGDAGAAHRGQGVGPGTGGGPGAGARGGPRGRVGAEDPGRAAGVSACGRACRNRLPRLRNPAQAGRHRRHLTTHAEVSAAAATLAA
jgi:hypothetical protein